MKRNLSHGITMLETSLVSIFLCALIFAAVGVTDHLEQVKFIHDLVEQTLDDSAVKPFKLQSSVEGSVSLQLNASALQAYVTGLLDTTSKTLERHKFPEYYVEAAYSKADIDPQNGQFLGFDPAASFFRGTGSLEVSKADLRFSNLRIRFEQLAFSSQAPGPFAQASLVAAPSATFAMGDVSENFLPGAVLVGLRVFASLEGTLAGKAYEQLGLVPQVEGYKIVQLRGVVE